MKRYKSSDLTHKRAEVLREAEYNGVIIQQRRTNGEIASEMVVISKSDYDEMGKICGLYDWEKTGLLAARSLLKRCNEILSDYTSSYGRNNDDVLQIINDVEISLDGDL